MDVEQAMTANPHVTNLSFTSCASIIPKPEQIMITSGKINKPLMVNANEPCNNIIVTSTDSSALDMYLNEGGKVRGELQDFVNEDGSLKSGHHAIKWYIRLLQLELGLHGLDQRSYMGDVCVLLNPLDSAWRISQNCSSTSPNMRTPTFAPWLADSMELDSLFPDGIHRMPNVGPGGALLHTLNSMLQ